MKKILLYLLAGVCSAQAQIPTNGLIGRWEFSGNANDLSGSANHGTVFGATLVPDRCGKPNSAYQFSGSDYIQMLSPGPLGNASRSVSFWAKTTHTASGNGFLAMAVFNYGGSQLPFGASFQVQINYNCQGLGLDVGDQQLIRGNGCISDNAWHHFVLVHDANGTQQLDAVDFYVDGVLQPQISCFQTGTTRTLNTGNLGPIIIGTDGNFPNAIRWYKGVLDDYYLYNRALSPGEVLQLFNFCSSTHTVCQGASQVYTVAPVTSAGTYTWNLPSGWSGSSTSSTIQVIPGSSNGTISVSAINNCGVVITQKLAVSVSRCLGIDKAEAGTLEAELIPNPAEDKLSIRGDFGEAPAGIRIIDVCGKTVYSGTLTEHNSLDISELKAGVYSVELTSGNRRTIRRLIKT